MADDDAMKKLEARLTRLEAAMAQQTGAGGAGTTGLPAGFIADPAPYPYGGWGGWGWRPHPIVDPAAFAAHGRPGVITDPGPTHFRPVVDPAAFASAAQPQMTATALGRIGPIGDPPPIDVSRFSIAQLEATLHSIAAEKARLASMETMVTQQLNTLKKQG